MKPQLLSITLILTCLQSIGWGQVNTFNLNIDFNKNADHGISVFPIDEGYFVISIGISFDTTIFDGIEIAVVNDSGVPIIQKFLGTPYES